MKIQIDPSKLKPGQRFDAIPMPHVAHRFTPIMDAVAEERPDDYCPDFQYFTEISHPELVASLIKSGETIKDELTPHDCKLIHALMGICGEAGELMDAIKKAAVYRKPLDRENVVEELGDLEFYMQDLRATLGITREETLEHNIAKLSKRYAGLNYSDKAAQDRADKVEGGQPQ